MHDYGWLFGFWGFLILLGFLESRISCETSDPNRRARWPVNLGFGIANGFIVSLIPAGTIVAASWAHHDGIGLLNWIEAPLWIAVVVTILARSLCQYIYHWLVHRIPALWAIHRVHHCDNHLDGSTGLRFHPLEVIVSLAFFVPVMIFLGVDPAALAIYETAEILIGIATHTSLKLPDSVERGLRVVFITPGLHRLHHSDHAAETDTNFGTVFSFWDRLFQTYLVDSVREPSRFRLGIKGIDARLAADFGWLLTSPLHLWRRPFKRRPDEAHRPK